MQPQSLFVECSGAIAAHRLHVLKWTKQSQAVNDLPPVICVHGLTRMGYDFVDLASALSANRDVYSLTMPGRGESEWLSDPMQYTYPNYVADCLQVIAQEIKAPQVDWVGTSMGGLIGMWVSAGHQQLIRKLVMNDIGPFLPLTAIQRIAFYAGRVANFQTMDEVERHCRAIYADFGIKSDAAWRFFAEKTVRVRSEGGYTLHYDPLLAKVFCDVKEDVSVWPLYDAVTCPTLLLRGARSDVLSVEVANDMTQRGPKAKLVTFEGCGHAPALIDAEQIKAVADFLA